MSHKNELYIQHAPWKSVWPHVLGLLMLCFGVIFLGLRLIWFTLGIMLCEIMQHHLYTRMLAESSSTTLSNECKTLEHVGRFVLLLLPLSHISCLGIKKSDFSAFAR